MRRTLSGGLSALLFVLSIILLSVNSISKSLDRYDCKTYKFTTTGDDDEDFKAKNGRKLFTILDNGNSLIVTMSSKDFSDSTSEYQVLLRSDDGIQAYLPSSILLETLYLSFSSIGTHNGTSEAGINLLSSFFSKTWLLSCEKAS